MLPVGGVPVLTKMPCNWFPVMPLPAVVPWLLKIRNGAAVLAPMLPVLSAVMAIPALLTLNLQFLMKPVSEALACGSAWMPLPKLFWNVTPSTCSVTAAVPSRPISAPCAEFVTAP